MSWGPWSGAGKRIELADIAGEVHTNAEALGAKFTAQQLLDMRDSIYGRLRAKYAPIFAGNIRPDVMLSWMDREEVGPFMREVVGPLAEAAIRKQDLAREWKEGLMGSVDNAYLQDAETKVDAPSYMSVDTPQGKVRVIRTKGNIRKALLYLGSETARSKMLEGMGWGPVQEAWLLQQATPADHAFIQKIWNLNAKHFRLADEMYMRHRGYGVEEDPARTVTFGDGTELKGGHIEVNYDPVLKPIMQAGKEAVGESKITKPPPNEQGGKMLEGHPAAALPVLRVCHPPHLLSWACQP